LVLRADDENKVTSNVARSCVRQVIVKFPVVAVDGLVSPAPLTMGRSCDLATRRGYIETWAVMSLPGFFRLRVVAKRAELREDSCTTGFWCTKENEGVDSACAAEGHVTAARLRSTTLSARHQVENRWNILVQATFGSPRSPPTATLHSQ
jgi:hypothetical protein